MQYPNRSNLLSNISPSGPILVYYFCNLNGIQPEVVGVCTPLSLNCSICSFHSCLIVCSFFLFSAFCCFYSLFCVLLFMWSSNLDVGMRDKWYVTFKGWRGFDWYVQYLSRILTVFFFTDLDFDEKDLGFLMIYDIPVRGRWGMGFGWSDPSAENQGVLFCCSKFLFWSTDFVDVILRFW
jgi:hypothetical protein